MHKSVWRIFGVLIETPSKLQKILVDRSDLQGLLNYVRDLEERIALLKDEEKEEK